ncbi:hypothetical protein AD998_11590 [bacterium 336/3]|nr:hypothetical protein AD998_11590 [bacterium 336/3]
MKETFQEKFKIKYILKATLFCIVFTGIFIFFSFFKSLTPEKFERLAHGTLGTIAAFLTTLLFIKFDEKSFTDIGLTFEKSTLIKFFIGFLLGIGIMGLSVLYVIYFSDFKIDSNTNSNIFNFLFWTLPLIPLAFMEEVGFRAYPLSILKNKIGIRNSIVITSILFALYHIANGWTIQNSFLGAGVWGILYGLVAIYSEGISMPTGLHYAANLTTSAFGISNNSFNIWTLRQKNGDSLENYQSSELMTLIPQLALLIFAIICMEWYLRKKNYN